MLEYVTGIVSLRREVRRCSMRFILFKTRPEIARSSARRLAAGLERQPTRRQQERFSLFGRKSENGEADHGFGIRPE